MARLPTVIEFLVTPGAVDGTGPAGGDDDPAGTDQLATVTTNKATVTARIARRSATLPPSPVPVAVTVVLDGWPCPGAGAEVRAVN